MDFEQVCAPTHIRYVRLPLIFAGAATFDAEEPIVKWKLELIFLE